MPALRELQAAFRDGLLAGDDRVLGLIAGGALPPAARLQIHRNNLFVSLTAALAAHFPVVQRLVGETFFAAVARRFIAVAPPRDPCLATYGAGFPTFLADDATAASLPFLADTARLEWAIHAARQATPAPALPIADLAAVSPDRLAATRLTLQPAVGHLTSPHAIDAIWRANQPDRDGTLTLDGAGRWLEVRPDTAGGATIVTLDAGELALRSRLAAGAPLGTATDHALACDPQLDLPRALHRLFGDALVTAIARPRVPSAREETGDDD